MPVPVFGGNPSTWASFNLQKENKQFDTQMLEFLRQLSAWASLVQTLTIQMLNGGLPAGPQGPAGPPGAQGPIGPAGPQGVNANTTSTSTFTVPAVGQTVSVTVADASWIVVGQMLYVDTAGGGPGLAGFLQVTAKSANTLTLLNPQPAPAIPLADNTQSGLLRQVSGNATDFVGGDNNCHAYSTIPTATSSASGLLKTLSGNASDFVDGTNNCQNLVTAIQPTIWSARLRSFNAIGNPGFEVDQINVGNTVSNIANNAKAVDRWKVFKAGTMQLSAGRNTGAAGDCFVPGTNFYISSYFLRLTLTTLEASLGAGDYFYLAQPVEGTQIRELYGDVHSLQLLVRSSVAGLKFGVILQDSTSAHSLSKLCTIPSSNTWTLVTLPNIPVWVSGGTWGGAAGAVGYYLYISLAAGSTVTAPANDTWQNGNFVGATGQSNFAANTINSTFDIAFVQHEPGSQCTTLMDCPFQQAYDSALRYYCKSYPYGTSPGAASTPGEAWFNFASTSYAMGYTPFPVPMAKTPAVTVYNSATGTLNGAQSFPTGTNVTITGASGISDRSFGYLTSSAVFVSGQLYRAHYTSDTGW